MRDALLAYGYRPGSGKGVFLIGYGGGGQVSLGLAAFLNRMLGSPVTVISVGGVMSSEPSCLRWSTSTTCGAPRTPSSPWATWPSSGAGHLQKSAWNQALRQGKITRIAMGPVAHNGSGATSAPAPPGRAPAIDQTLEVILPIVTTGAPPPDAPPAKAPNRHRRAGRRGSAGAGPGRPGARARARKRAGRREWRGDSS